jgi:hypothetical protein
MFADLGMYVASCHPSGSLRFEDAPRFFENLCKLGLCWGFQNVSLFLVCSALSLPYLVQSHV